MAVRMEMDCGMRNKGCHARNDTAPYRIVTPGKEIFYSAWKEIHEEAEEKGWATKSGICPSCWERADKI